MKISKVQKEVIGLMDDGWELGKYSGMQPRVCLQKGGLGRGGETRDIKFSTLSVLLKRELIEEKQNNHLYKSYVLTLLGEIYNGNL